MFRDILTHLKRKKKDKVTILKQKDNFLEFDVTNGYFDKDFQIFYFDAFTKKTKENRSLVEQRQRGKHYYLVFWQENYIERGHFIDLSECEWFGTEDEVINEIKRLCRSWRR